jgi:hypothetical protein
LGCAILNAIYSMAVAQQPGGQPSEEAETPNNACCVRPPP